MTAPTGLMVESVEGLAALDRLFDQAWKAAGDDAGRSLVLRDRDAVANLIDRAVRPAAEVRAEALREVADLAAEYERDGRKPVLPSHFTYLVFARRLRALLGESPRGWGQAR